MVFNLKATGTQPIAAPSPGVRPVDWLLLPDPGPETFIGLIAVFDDDANFLAVNFAGDYTVNWGDGTVDNVASGAQANHTYTYADLPAASLCSRGYRQAIVVVTPQAAAHFGVPVRVSPRDRRLTKRKA